MPSPAVAAPCFCPAATKEGYLPPWEVAKAFAFHTALQDVAEVQGVQPHELVGKRVDEHISEKVALKGGGHPSNRAARALLKKCESSDWFPGKGLPTSGGALPCAGRTRREKHEDDRLGCRPPDPPYNTIKAMPWQPRSGHPLL